MMNTAKPLSFAVLLLLGACASDEKVVERLCPQVAVLRPLERIEDYGGDTIDPANLVAVGVMERVEGRCAYEDEGVEVTFKLTMQAEKGPRLGGDKISFPYFTSVVDPADKILAKDMGTAEFVFDGEGKTAKHEQPLRVVIPLTKDEDGGNHRVLVGFQLSEAQMRIGGPKETQK